MINSFPPIIDAETEILILGTIPGIQSLNKQEYYGNPRNQFWSIIFTLYSSFPISEIFEEKVSLLQKNKIGLWDVLAYCERKGSLDIHIKNQTENDIALILKTFPKIKTLVFNGKESHKYFIRKFGSLSGIQYHIMPSTSPAHTISFDDKLKCWATVLK